MLYLIALPPPLQAGTYRVTVIGSGQAGRYINRHSSAGELLNRITRNMQSTLDVVNVVSATKLVAPSQIPLQPRVVDGDCFIQCKLAEHVPRPVPESLATGDIEFLLIEYSE